MRRLHQEVLTGACLLVALACGGGGGSTNTPPPPPATASLSFTNPVFTNIGVTVNGQTQTLPPGGTVTFSGLPKVSTSFTAYTSGLTSTGTQVGDRQEWNSSQNLANGDVTVSLFVPSTTFFIYITNSSTNIFQGFYVNYGLVSQTLDNIIMAPSSIKYGLGYYKAWSNSNARFYLQSNPSIYYGWSTLPIPFTINQKVDLIVLNPTVVTPGEPARVLDGKPAMTLLPFVPSTPFKLDPEAVIVYSTSTE